MTAPAGRRPVPDPGTHRVLLVDDHPLFRTGLRRVLEGEPGLTVVGEAASADQARALAARLRPDVVLVDVNLGAGETDGIELVATLRAERPEVGLVVLTMYDDDALLLRALQAGASGFSRKTAAAEEILALVRHAVASPRSFTAEGLADALSAVQRPAAPRPELTAREREVLERLASGAPLPAIARAMFLSTSTLKTYVSRVYGKLEATSRTEAVVAGVRHGLIQLDA